MKTSYIYIIVGVLSFLLYANTLTHEFVWDDQIVITENEYTLQGIGGLKDIWTKNTYLSGRDVYRPIPQSIHAIEWHFFPNSPFIGHLTVLLSYILLIISLLFAIKLFFPEVNNWLIFFIGLMFSLLPVHVEVVANIKSLDEILSALFSIWSIVFLKKISLRNILFSALFLILALLSKISAITILPFIFLLLVLPLNINFSKHLETFKLKIDYLSIIALIFFLIAAYFYKIGAYNPIVYYPLFFALIFTVFIRNRIIKLNLFLIITIALSYFGRGEFSLLVLIILFDQDLKLENFNKFLWIGIFIIFSLITTVLDFNSLLNSIVIFLLLLCYYYNKKFGVEKIRYLYYAFFITTLIITLIENELSFKIPYIFLVILIISSKSYTTKTFKTALLLLLIIPIIEMSFNYRDYQDSFNQLKNIGEVNTISNIEVAEITPYHNILIAAETYSQKIATISRIQLIYLQKLIFPINLIHQHGTKQIEFASWKNWDVYLSIIIHLLIIYLAFYFYKRKHYLTMWGIAWYFITMSIYTNIVRLMPDTMAERFLLMPSIGFSIAFISAMFFFINRTLKNEAKTYKTLAIILTPLFIYYTYKTIDRNKDWKNNYTLAANTIAYTPNNAVINAQYAFEVNNLIENNSISNKDSAQAIVLKHYQKAIDIFPNFYAPNSDLAMYYIKQANPNKAFPYLIEASRIKPSEWSHHYYLALIYFERKKYNEAIERFTIIQNNEELFKNPFAYPELLDSYEYEARCLHNLGKDSLAIIQLEKGIEIFNQKSTYILLANIYRTTGKGAKAIEVFEKLLIQNPGDQELINTIQFLKEGKIY